MLAQTTRQKWMASKMGHMSKTFLKGVPKSAMKGFSSVLFRVEVIYMEDWL